MLITSTPFGDERHVGEAKFADRGGLDEYMDTNICVQMRDVAKELNLPLCDLHGYFKAEFNNNPNRIKQLIRSDGVHLTEEGNKVTAEYLLPMVNILVKTEDTSRAEGLE